MSPNLQPIQAQALKTYLAEREGETRIGQEIHLLNGPFTSTHLRDIPARFVLVGIPEDIGVRANFGKPGTAGFWEAFLGVFLNIQSNHFLQGKAILLAGTVNCHDLMSDARDCSIEQLSLLVQELDKRVEEVLTPIFEAGRIPIVIGGGHNNAYPIIKAARKVFQKKIGVVNIDPHADLRATGNRHSGNGFSQALKEDLLQFYLQVGLHESYNNTHILDLYKKEKGLLHYFSFDDFLKGKWSIKDLETFMHDCFKDMVTGFELDTDSMENFPSSAQTPSGFTGNEARKLTMLVAQTVKPVYFHLPEAIPSTTPFNSMKMASYLVSDFMKNYAI